MDLLPILWDGNDIDTMDSYLFFTKRLSSGDVPYHLYVVCLVARQFLQPKMIADSMGLDSMTTLVLIYSGYKLDGMKGMILGVTYGGCYYHII